jgi:hypothetical protein
MICVHASNNARHEVPPPATKVITLPTAWGPSLRYERDHATHCMRSLPFATHVITLPIA